MSERTKVAELMVAVHLISRELADHHVREMADDEIERWLRRYSEMELSAVGPTPRAGAERSTRFSRPATMTAGLRHSTLFPSSRPSKETRQKTARFGGKEPGPRAGRALSAGR